MWEGLWCSNSHGDGGGVFVRSEAPEAQDSDWLESRSALRQRRNLPMWIPEEVVQTWHVTEAEPTRGHPRTYIDTAIEPMATRQEICHLGVRQTQGWMELIGARLHLELAMLDDLMLSRRRAASEVALLARTASLPLLLYSSRVLSYSP